VSSPTRNRAVHCSRTVLGGIGYLWLLLVSSFFAGISIDPGPSLLGTGLPVVVPSTLGMALVGGFAAALTGFGLRAPALVAIVAVPVAVIDEASSLRPSLASLGGIWAILAVLVVAVAAIEYGLGRLSRPGESAVHFSRRTERALFGGTIAACGLLLAFSLRGVGPLATLSATGALLSPSTLATVVTAFGPPALLVWGSIPLVLRYGLVTPLVSIPAVGALLANPLGFAFFLFTAASPLVFVIVLVLAASEYSIRIRLSSFRPRSLVG